MAVDQAVDRVAAEKSQRDEANYDFDGRSWLRIELTSRIKLNIQYWNCNYWEKPKNQKTRIHLMETEKVNTYTTETQNNLPG